MNGTGRPTITLVPDCGGGVGYGHLERTLALGGVLQPVADTIVVIPHDASIEARLTSKGRSGVSLPGGPAERALGAVSLGTAMVLDGYEFPISVQATLRDAMPLAVVDDLALPSDCDLAINPSPGSGGTTTPGASSTLAGPRFAIVDPVYRARHAAAREPADGDSSVYVSTGGSGMGGVLARLVEALLTGNDGIRVLTASLDPGDQAPSKDARVTAYRGLSDVSQLMEKAAMYVGSAGTTAIQAACAGLPAILLPVAANQVAQAHALEEAGCALTCDLADLVTLNQRVSSLLGDPDTRLRMSLAGMRLIDGEGAGRVAQALVALAASRHGGAGAVS